MEKLTLTSNKLKIIAIIAMVFDHFVGGFIPIESTYGLILRAPGRIAAPIMCYMIAEGYYHTKNLNKYILRLLIFAVISHIPYNMYFGLTFFQATSVMWSLTMGLIALAAVKSDVHPILKILAVGLCCFLSVTANWNYIAVLWIVSFGVFKGNFKMQALMFTVIALLQILPIYLGIGPVKEIYPHWYRFGIFLALPLLYLYKGERGKKSKALSMFFYLFYPLHLIILNIIKTIIRSCD